MNFSAILYIVIIICMTIFIRCSTESYISTYDFVIIGAGSGGSVLANRLSEVAEWKILLIEAGKEEIFLTDVPLLAPIMQITDYNWGYRTEPKKGQHGYCLSMVDGRCNWPRGKAVGGTSVINFMIYTRGGKADYDKWEAYGNTGWGYDDILPYFLKSENNRLKYHDKRYHSSNGYLDVSDVPYVSRLRNPFLQSAKEFGYKINDYNAERLLGFSAIQANLRNGRRVSASKAFLDPIRQIRKNLRILTFARVVKILIEPETHRAIGVKFLDRNQKMHIVKAKREVLLCAGTLNSAQLLMLSGVGPRQHLKQLGIQVIEDLPVGYNLQDHVSMGALTFLVNDTVTIMESRLLTNPVNVFDYFIKGTGPFTVPGGAEALAFIDTKTFLERDNHQDETADYPDIELVLGIGALTGDLSGSMRHLFALTDDFDRQVFADHKGSDAFSIVPILMKPKSYGRVSLRSANPLDPPILEANYYEQQEDLDTMIRGIKAGIKVGMSQAFKHFNTTLLPMTFNGCDRFVFNTDEYWSCVARHISTTLGHFTGTCKMAPRTNGGVVDPRLRVYGVKSLRVIDASIMPEIIAGHTCAPTYMIGEKAADMIKEDWAVSTI
ncbi:PREDICTED: glucose dehydrogenase [FAD, quinone]-like [Ceratosolen solmsi marchali]|uniref:Glucose dehydrogenase [FAD, quinone]-like n=1 Tax=Ceratosolen solmsi marchali TaxID=326594 RepID=A0AAJ7DYU0_9HYME|nr:PREDICTED: glucose dehydrogenase [FAD, quinone]-like [Ceratosolen solmsi marchali]